MDNPTSSFAEEAGLEETSSEMANETHEDLLAPYVVLELATTETALFGRTFADLGARVIAVEPPGGSPARRLGPFADGEPGLERGLFWLGYGAGKQSVTLNLDTRDGQALFRKLVSGADFVVEGFPPGYLAARGLAYEDLRAQNERVVLVSLTPYGQEGPYRSYAGDDLLTWALGGYMHMVGDPDRAPLRVGLPPQASLHLAMAGVVGALAAHFRRLATGHGEHVDVAAQEVPLSMLTHTYAFADLSGVNLQRQGMWRDLGPGRRSRTLYQCKDGWVVWMFMTFYGGARTARKLMEWMDSEGAAPEWLKQTDWATFDPAGLPPDEVDRFLEPFTAFLRTKTKAELLEAAVRDGHMFSPVNTLADVLADPQLAARASWREVADTARAIVLRYPGVPVHTTGAPWVVRGPAPRLGQHNRAVLVDELGLSSQELELLFALGVV